ncbi:MAG: hypothetical protein H6570_03955 [Lewinellaceae bacterium]|nr:hypothetical protein [Lewinellaceae bacterium]
MKSIIVHLLLFTGIYSFAQPTDRNLKTVTFTGEGYELGVQHGKTLKTEIAGIIAAWKKNTSTALEKDADAVLKDFFEYAHFDDAIRKWTPDLYQEIRGIADGSGQAFNDIMVLNLLDEFWVYVNNLNNHHCSGIGVPATGSRPGYISQNMDLENYTDGFQVMMRIEKSGDQPEQLILTHPGLIALNGLNEQGIGVCVNTLMQLQASSTGLPVAFIIRRIIRSTDKEDLLQFIQTVPHASGQNYIIGIKGEVFDFEASANQVTRFNPVNENGSVYHTNHPLANDDVKPWFAAFKPSGPKGTKQVQDNSYYRFKAVEQRISKNKDVSESTIMATLRSRDFNNNPVCRTNLQNGKGYTFASVIMTMADKPYIQVTPGPPDESAYERFEFNANQYAGYK